MKAIIKKLTDFLYAQEPFELVFDVSPKEAARRLSTYVHKTPFTGLMSERMIGNVSVVTGVRVRQETPFLKNSFRPVMDGTFTVKDGKTKLTGVFRLHLIARSFMTLWLGLLSLIFLVVLIRDMAITGEISPNFFALIFVFCFSVGVVKISKLSAKDDKQWLIKRVTSAIEEDA